MFINPSDRPSLALYHNWSHIILIRVPVILCVRVLICSVNSYVCLCISLFLFLFLSLSLSLSVCVSVCVCVCLCVLSSEYSHRVAAMLKLLRPRLHSQCTIEAPQYIPSLHLSVPPSRQSLYNSIIIGQLMCSPLLLCYF